MELRWPTDRIDYVPITKREPLPLPDGAKLIVWPCVNVEHWVISEPMPRTVVAPPGGATTVRGIGSLITQCSTFTQGQTISLAPSGRGKGSRSVMGT